MTGTVLKGIGGFYYVASNGETVECKARGRFRNEKIIPLPGDRVLFSRAEDGRGRLDEILPRKNEFTRPPVSNLDLLVIVISEAPPKTDTFLVDRITAIAGYKNTEVIICINKCDLNYGGELFDIYSRAGFKTLRVSAETGEGIDSLRTMIAGKFSAFTGNSGVGKSSILNSLKPELTLEVGEVSRRLGRGRHTTRHVELFTLPGNSVIADTPGFSSFDTEKMERIKKEEMQNVFIEFKPHIDNCRFTHCSHIKDSGCAVKAALEKGEILKSRYESYVKLYEKAAELKDWEK